MAEPTPSELLLAAPSSPAPDYDAVIDDLARLSADHLLYFRVQVGRTISHAFFGNDRSRYYDQASNKPTSLRQFCRDRARQLADLGLNEELLRKSILAWFVVEDLPHALAQRLQFSHVVSLARVPDATTRQLLAQATLDNAWSGATLDDAIAAVNRGRWIDADPDTAGLQPPPPEPEPAKRVAPGRVVTRFERALDDLGALSSQWDEVPVEKLSAAQARRMAASLSKMEEHIARVRARLKAAEG